MPWPNDSTPLFGGQSGAPLQTQHLSEHQNIKAAVAGLTTHLGLPPNTGGSPLLSRAGITPSAGPIFWIGDSYEDEANANSDGNTWAHVVNSFFGQSCVSRWIAAGGPPNPFGTNYAVASASLTGGPTTITAQINQLLADYPSGLPSNCIVVLAIGINDTDNAVGAAGSVWTLSTWTTSGFTNPSSGTIVIPVTSSTGAAAGTSAGAANTLAYLYTPNNTVVGFQIVSVPDGTHITVNFNATFPGFSVPNGGILKPYGAVYLDSVLATPSWTTAFNNLVAALPANGTIIVTSPPDVSLFPYNIATGYASFYHTSWQYWRAAAASLYPVSAPKIASWDFGQALTDVVTNFPPISGTPSKFGFKNVTSGSGNVAGQNPSDFAFWSSGPGAPVLHPTGAMHRIYAHYFLEFLRQRGYISIF